MDRRYHGMDNLKGLLIFCVVLGHVLECCPAWNGWNLDLYRLIYSFHMPVFLFLSGWFARSRPGGAVFRLGYLYFLFQMLYLLFSRYVLGNVDLALQFTTPHWLLWYLLVLLGYHLVLPLLDVQGGKKQTILLLVCIALAVATGFDDTIGYYLSLGRFFSFLPFFAAGHYAAHRHSGALPAPSLPVKLALTGAVVCVSLWFCLYCSIPSSVFWGSYSYADTGFGWRTELTLMAIAFLWLAFFLGVVCPLLNRSIPLLTALGENTLPVFLLHGFVILYMKQHDLLFSAGPAQALLLTVLLLAALGNRLTARVFRTLFTGWWLKKLWDKL